MSEHRAMFDINRDKAVIGSGGFWCFGCLAGKPAAEASNDPRYCLGCYGCLKEDSVVSGRKRGSGSDESPAGVAPKVTGASPDNDKGCHKVAHGKTLRESSVTDLITGRIRELAARGMSCRSIEKKLAKDGVIISYRTIHRRLQGSMAI